MARPTKQGIDYFPLDVSWDDKIQLFIEEQGASGLCVWITLLQMIYGDKGYWILDEPDLALKVKRRINVDINSVYEVINSCLRRQLFHQGKHDEFKILTSAAIQRRFFPITSRKKWVYIVDEFTLIPVNEYKNLVSVDINSAIVLNNATKEIKGKGKEKERKGNPVRVIADNNSPPEKNDFPKDRKKTRWPKDFVLTEKRRQYAINQGIDDPEGEWETMRLKDASRHYRNYDWDAFWMTWCRNKNFKKASTGEGGLE